MGTPYVSVIMPVRDEAAHLERSLGSIVGQDYPADRMEVLVVDGMSTDGTRERVRRIAAATSAPVVRLLDNPRRIVPAALNRGIAAARGSVIVRVDGHCVIRPDHVSRCVELLRDTGAENVGGVTDARGVGLLGRAIALATTSRFGVGGSRFRVGSAAGWVDTVFPGAWPREVFERVGGFDEDLVRNQDDEMNLRIRQAGGRIWLDPALSTEYFVRSDLSSLWRQYWQYGAYKVRVLQKRHRLPAARALAPPLFVTALVAGAAAWAATGAAAWLLAPAAPYAAANLASSAAVGRRDLAAAPLLPVVYAVLHLAYGAGFLAGLWRWRSGWASEPTRPPALPAERTGTVEGASR